MVPPLDMMVEKISTKIMFFQKQTILTAAAVLMILHV